jgi:hypothetical protein
MKKDIYIYISRSSEDFGGIKVQTNPYRDFYCRHVITMNETALSGRSLKFP